MSTEGAAIRPRAARPWLSSLVAGLVFAVAALVAAPIAEMPVRWAPSGEGGEISAATLFAGVLLSGWVLWWLLVARRARVGWARGGVTGILVACISYSVVLGLAEFLQIDWQSRSDLAWSVPERLQHVLELASFALLTTGSAATLLLALVGMAVGFLQRPMGATQPTAARPQGAMRFVFDVLGFAAVSIVIVLATTFAALSLLPIEPLAPPVEISAATSYSEAVAAFESIRDDEADLPLHPRCGTTLLTHGEKVAKVVVFLHGVTNCPAQADELAPWLFTQGHNVLVPRLPGHGEADPLTLALADVSAEDFVATAQRSLSVAAGLGDEVIVIGLSAGGTLALHQAQHESQVANAISVAPFLAPLVVPRWAATAATNLLLLLPNQMVWWDPRAPYSSPEMDYAYPRFATHALGEIMRLGRIVSAEAKAAPPAAGQAGFLLNEADLAVNNGLALQVAADWRQHGGTVILRLLPRADGMPHDLIDPRQPDAAVDVIYPMLGGMMSLLPPQP